MNMKLRFLAMLFAGGLTVFGTGCVQTVDGRNEAGVPFIRDKVEGRYDVSVQRVVDASRAVLKLNGQLLVDNAVNNSLEAKINQVSVYVHVEAVDPNKPITLVQVEVRNRVGGTNIELAHDLEKQIALQMMNGH